jgi:hypothetical protein
MSYPADQAETVTGELAPRKSTEKVLAVIEQLAAGVPGPAGVGLQVMLKSLMAQFPLPTDPEEIDERLLAVARTVLGLRSDEAAAYGLIALDFTVAAVAGIGIHPAGETSAVEAAPPFGLPAPGTTAPSSNIQHKETP